MEVKIGVQNVARELTIDATLDAEGIQKAVSDALGGGILVLEDAKGRRIVVAGDKLAYVEVSTSTTGAVGFRG